MSPLSFSLLFSSLPPSYCLMALAWLALPCLEPPEPELPAAPSNPQVRAVILSDSAGPQARSGQAESQSVSEGRRFEQRLLDLGVPQDQITTMHKVDGPRNSELKQSILRQCQACQADDTLLVYLRVPGRVRDAHDYLWTTSETGAPADLSGVRLQEVIRWLTTARTARRLLVVSVETEDPGFGQERLAIPQDTWVIVHAGSQSSLNINTSLPTFSQAIRDAFSSHSDMNLDRQVSLFEVTDYLTRFARTHQLRRPRIHTHSHRDQPLLRLTDRDASRDTATELRTVAERLMNSALMALIVDQDLSAAEDLLQRLARYRLDPSLATRMDRLMESVSFMQSFAPPSSGSPIPSSGSVLAVLSESTQLRADATADSSDSRRQQPLQAGWVVELTDRKGGEYRVQRVFKTNLANGVVAFESLQAPSGWIAASALRRTSRTDVYARIERLSMTPDPNPPADEATADLATRQQ